MINYILAKPDQFVNQFTGDYQWKVHQQKTDAREYNKGKIVDGMYRDYNLSPSKMKAQHQENLNNFYNGHQMPNSGRFYEQIALNEALKNQILTKNVNKNFYMEEEIRETQRLQELERRDKEIEIQNKIKQRNELMNEIQKVLEEKRQAKLRELHREVENFL